MAFAAILFDFDGLMIESERIALQIWVEVTESLGAKMEQEINQLIIGKAPARGAEIVCKELGLQIDPSELRELYWQARIIAMCREAKPVDGLEALIDLALRRTVPMGVASNSPTDYVDQVLEAISMRKKMRCVVGSDQVGRGKPAPDVYIEASNRLGVAPDRCLALEDSPTGIAAAIAAGLTCYAVPNPDLSGEDFSGAHRSFDSMLDLYKTVKDQWSSLFSG